MSATLMFYGLYPLTRIFSNISVLWRRILCVYINSSEDCGDPYNKQILPDVQMDLLQHNNTTTNNISTSEETERRIKREKREREDGTEKMMCDDVYQIKTEELTEDSDESYRESFLSTDINLLTSISECSHQTDDCDLNNDEEFSSDHLLTTFDHQVYPDEKTQSENKPEHHTHAYEDDDSPDKDSNRPDDDEEKDDDEEEAAAKESNRSNNDDDDDEVKKSESSCSDILLSFDGDNRSESLLMSSSPVFDLKALISDDHSLQLPLESAGFHFPVGLGLSDVCYSPFGKFPSDSYYPVCQSNDDIEVTWRVWEDLSETSTDPPAEFEFSIMSYNILSQDLLTSHPELYKHCKDEVLVWDLRLLLILQEIRLWKPDILCLQEVQEDHYLSQIYPVLTEIGYTCIYKRRTGERTDGCAVCYQSNRFNQLSVKLLEFYRPGCELLNRDNVGIVLLLQPITEQHKCVRPICVANTHLVFNPKRGDVKLTQLVIVLAEIDLMIKKCEGKSCEIILCGDFNALPNSPLLNFITSGQLYYHALPLWMVSGQVDLSDKFYQRKLVAPLWPNSLAINNSCQYEGKLEKQTNYSEKLPYSRDFLCHLRYHQSSCVRPSDLDFIPGVTDNKADPEEIKMFNARSSIFHSLSLNSAYPDMNRNTQKSLLTTLNSDGGGMVDYICYSTHQNTERDGGLKLIGRLSLLSEADLWSLNGLPNEIFPSDHLSLIAKFQLR